MSLVTVDEVKTILRITNTKSDDLIALLIPMVEAELKLICNRTFLDSEGAEDWPEGLQYYGSQMIGYAMTANGGEGLASETIGDYSYSKTGGGEIIDGWPKGIMDALIARYKWITGSIGSIFIQCPELRGYPFGIIPKTVKEWR